MTWFLRLGAALLLTIGMASNAFAATDDGKTAATAFTLPSSLSATGTLAGLPDGAFTFYTLSYPGNGDTGTITLNVTPSDTNTTNAVGVNIYHDGANLLSMNGMSLIPGNNIGTFSSATAGPLLVEIYNYLPGQLAAFNFAITGITGQATVAAVPVASGPAPTGAIVEPPAAAPDSGGKTAMTAMALPASLSAAGTFAGSSNGAFTFYTFNYPGNGSVGTITLNVNPSDSNTTNAVGVNLYHAGANLLTLNGLGLTPGSNTGTFTSSTAGPILVEIYNYLPGQSASYNFAITGLTP